MFEMLDDGKSASMRGVSGKFGRGGHADAKDGPVSTRDVPQASRQASHQPQGTGRLRSPHQHMNTIVVLVKW